MPINANALAAGTTFPASGGRKNNVMKIRCRADSGFPIEVVIRPLNGSTRIPIAVGESEIFRGDLGDIQIYGVGGTAKIDLFAVGNI
jgi:hypothetical protein